MLVQIPLSAAERSTARSTCCTRSPSSNEASAQPSFSTAAYVLAASRPTITNISGTNGKSKNRGATCQAWLWAAPVKPAPVKPVPDHGDAQWLRGCHSLTSSSLSDRSLGVTVYSASASTAPQPAAGRQERGRRPRRVSDTEGGGEIDSVDVVCI
jgi:hypothetical protein